MIRPVLAIFLLINLSAQAQIFNKSEGESRGFRLPKYVATKNSTGMIGGIERGNFTYMELGIEKHWKVIRFKNARTLAANANLEYNFGNHLLGYNVGGWMKHGRVDLTYGFNLNYITDFELNRYGMGPQIGFRLMGLHFVNGYNFYYLGDKELQNVNKLYVGLRYYFPLQSTTKVENVNKRTDKEKIAEKKEKEKIKTQKQKAKIKAKEKAAKAKAKEKTAKEKAKAKEAKSKAKEKAAKNNQEAENKKKFVFF
ncbi:hypothetical protein BH23BAC1_BH23BAC1_35090 [soil metagenome]